MSFRLLIIPLVLPWIIISAILESFGYLSDADVERVKTSGICSDRVKRTPSVPLDPEVFADGASLPLLLDAALYCRGAYLYNGEGVIPEQPESEDEKEKPRSPAQIGFPTIDITETVKKKPKFIYAIPDFQNPTGITMTLEQREYLVRIARKYDTLILEDSPYKEIRFEGEHLPYIYSMAPERTIMLGTFSKTFAPGFRLGWVLASKEIIDRLIVAKQSSDLCTPIFCQEIAASYLEKGLFDKNLKNTIDLYRGKRDLMLECLEKNMPEGVTWTRPEGGLFMFVTLPEYMNARELFDVAIQENVAFVTGDAFCCDGGGLNTLRLNFSFASNEQIVEGIARLGRAVKRMLK